MVKLDLSAVKKLLAGATRRRRYIGRMPTFTHAGLVFEYIQATPNPADSHSWEYPDWPRVEVAMPLKDGGTVAVYGEASRWAGQWIHARWADDNGNYHGAWVPAGNVRRLTASEWDIIEYDRCPPALRAVRWADRLPGFLPESPNGL